QFIQAGTLQRILVIGGETLSRFTNWEDRATCVLFGDGAGAVVLEATDQECGTLSSVLGSRGDVDHLLAIEAGGSARPTTAAALAEYLTAGRAFPGDHLLLTGFGGGLTWASVVIRWADVAAIIAERATSLAA